MTEYEIWAIEQELESMLALNPKSEEQQKEIEFMQKALQRAKIATQQITPQEG